VFAVSTVNLTNGGVLTINGTGLTVGQDVVFNIAANNPSFDGAISLIGLTDDQVLINIIGSNSTLAISSNDQTLSGDFLDYSGNIQMNHSLLDGCLFGGSSQNMQVVSGATIVAPAETAVPEPSSLAVLGFMLSLSASCGTAFVRLRAFGPRDLRPLTGAAPLVRRTPNRPPNRSYRPRPCRLEGRRSRSAGSTSSTSASLPMISRPT
jgi:hypothetical protein